MTIVFPRVTLRLSSIWDNIFNLHKVRIHTVLSLWILEEKYYHCAFLISIYISTLYYNTEKRFSFLLNCYYYHTHTLFTYGLVNPEHWLQSTVTCVVSARKVIKRLIYLSLTMDIIATISMRRYVSTYRGVISQNDHHRQTSVGLHKFYNEVPPYLMKSRTSYRAHEINLTFMKSPSPDLNLTPLAAFLRFLPSAARVRS